jgi:hypothetical protein
MSRTRQEVADLLKKSERTMSRSQEILRQLQTLVHRMERVVQDRRGRQAESGEESRISFPSRLMPV